MMNRNENLTFSLITFGCKVNAYESEAIKEEMIKAGFVYKEEVPADLIFINTCAVTLVSENKAMEKIRSLGRNYPSSRLIVLGCFAQLHPERIKAVPEVSLIIGTKDRKQIVNLVKGILNEKEQEVLVDKNSRLFSYDPVSISHFNASVRAFVKIQDGCDNFCSYCVIPLTRGKSRSRDKDEVIQEIQRLVDNGYKEIVLTGIDIGSYSDHGLRLDDLVYQILHTVQGQYRLRISSLEMSQIDARYIALYKNEKKLVPHIHIPLQSGSERILELMNRKYDLNHFLEVVKILKEEIPDVALSTDVITGFPSETEKDFLDSVEFIRKVGFMRLHVFPYSRRPYTKADKMKEQLPNAVKKDRARRLIKVGEELAQEYFDKNIGKELNVLIEEKLADNNDGSSTYRGYSENYLDLKVRSADDIVGKMVKGLLQEDGFLEVKEII